MAAQDLAAAAERISSVAEIRTDPKDALELALSKADPDDVVLGTGSLYVVGALRDAYFSNHS